MWNVLRYTIELSVKPTGKLDSKNTQLVMNLPSVLHQQGSTICMVTYDPRFAGHANREVVLFDCKVVDDHVNADVPPRENILTASVKLRSQ